MIRRLSFGNRSQLLLALAVFWGLITCRALPAFFRGSYTTEGGEWLSAMWRIGFFEAIKTTRPDYCVLGNLVVLQLSEWINVLLHGANIDRAPMIQHHVAVGYLAVSFLFIFTVLRRCHGLWGALLVCLAMLLVPDLDGEHRIFGEATNLGYFSALVVLFVYYDVWLNPGTSTRRLLGYLLLVLFHIATSPMAGVITLAWSGLMIARLFLQPKSTQSMSAARIVAFLAPAILFALFTIERAQRSGPASAATDMGILKRDFVEVVLARQLLYPLITNFFLALNDKLTLIAFAMFLGFIGWFVSLEWRHEKRDWQRLSAILVIFAAAIGMSLATAVSRQWIYARELHYASLWPARYYIAQNMVMAGFIALLLLRLCELKPRLQTAVLVFAGMMGTNFVLQQQDNAVRYFARDNPAIVARYWPYQLRREHAVQALIGDSLLARTAQGQGEEKPEYTVEINIDGHFMHPEVERMEKAVATKPALKSDVVPVGVADPATLKPDGKDYSDQFHVHDFTIIPRQQGALVTFDLEFNGMPAFADKRRKLWLGKLPGEVKSLCFIYEMPETERTISELRKDRKPLNRLLKVYVFIQGAWTVEDLRRKFEGLPCVLGEAPEKYTAATTVLGPADIPRLSAFAGDDRLALRLHPLKVAHDWDGSIKQAKLHNCTLVGDLLSLKNPEPEDFEEEAFLRTNPDVANAVAHRVISSGRAYYDVLGRNENRQICGFSATLPITGAPLPLTGIAGIRVQLDRGQGPRPTAITCVLHGDNVQSPPLQLTPVEGLSEYATYYLPENWAATPQILRSVEIQFEGITGVGHTFSINELKLFSH